jgi:Ca2+-binding RTX toxin-like protein
VANSPGPAGHGVIAAFFVSDGVTITPPGQFLVSKGNDSTEGGDDTLEGRPCNDTIIGATEAHVLPGGSGLDVFVCEDIPASGRLAGARDVIRDFAPGEDRIDPSGIDGFPLSGPALDAAAAFPASRGSRSGPGAC